MRTKLNNGREYELEAQYGLPEPLPKNEQILWQGSPDVLAVAKHVFHIRIVIVYFLGLIIWRLMDGFEASQSLNKIGASMLWMGLLSALSIGLLMFLAACIAKTTAYTITDRRVVMRIGVVLTMSFNIPLSAIEGADTLKRFKHFGSIALKIENNTKIALVHLWPHARPWQFAHPQPMLIGLKDIDKVAKVLTTAWMQANQQTSLGIQNKEALNTVKEKPIGTTYPSSLTNGDLIRA